MNLPMEDCAKPVKEPDVFSKLNQCDNMVAELEVLLERLIGKLSPVMAQREPAPPCGDCIHDATIPEVSVRINSITSRLDGCCRASQETIDRLEI